MALQQNMGDPLMPWTGYMDYAFNDDVNAITEYIENQRPNIKKYPKLQRIIEDYEKWLTNLGWSEKYFLIETTVSQAVWYRDQVNDAMGVAVDPSIIPGDIMNKKVAIDPKDAPGLIGSIINTIFPAKDRKLIMGIGAAALGGYLLWIFGPAIKNTATKLSKPKNVPIPYSDKYHLKGDILAPPMNDINTIRASELKNFEMNPRKEQ